QRRIHGNLKRKDTEMMLQWLQQEKIGSGVPCTFPGKEGNPCSSGRIGRRNHSDPGRLKSPYHFCPLSSPSLHEMFPWYL
ncbi:hypothetical protein K5549_020506, partial [Capra hircus]